MQESPHRLRRPMYGRQRRMDCRVKPGNDAVRNYFPFNAFRASMYSSCVAALVSAAAW